MITTVLSPWNVNPDAGLIETYRNALEDLPDDDLRNGVRLIIRDRVKKEGAPAPADIRRSTHSVIHNRLARAESVQKPVVPPKIIGKLTKIMGESAFEKHWTPESPEERAAAKDFADLMDEALGTFTKSAIRSRIKMPHLTEAHRQALAKIGGVTALKNLEPHEVLVCREMFIKEFVKFTATGTLPGSALPLE